MLQTLGIQNVKFQKANCFTAFNENSLDIFIGKQKIGVIGEIELSITEKLIKKAAFGFEIYPEKIPLYFKSPEIKKTSKFPLSTRDINIVIDQSVSYQEVENLIASKNINHLTAYSLLNTFEGKDIPKGSVSMTLRLTFQSVRKSLTDSDISTSMEKVLQILSKTFSVKIRA